MNTLKRIAKNNIVLFISQILTYIFGFFFIIYTANYLGSEGFGILSFAISFTGIFIAFTDLGLNMLMVREIARFKSLTNKYLINVLSMKMILAIFVLGLITLSINLFNYSYEVIITVYIIALSTILTPFYETFYFVFQAHEKMELQSICTILYNFLLLFGAITAIHYSFSIINFAYVYLIASITVLICAFTIFISKFDLNNLNIDLNFWKSTIKAALPLSLFVISTVVIFRIDAVILSILKGNVIVGWYTAAYKLMEMFMVVPTIFMASIYPVISDQHISSKESLCFSCEKSFKFLFILGIPIATGVMILSNQIIAIFYKTSFNPSILILQILILTIPLFYISYLFKILLISTDKQYLVSKIIFICMIFNLTFNVLLIPYFSYLAASIINVITELIFLIFGFYYIPKFICKIQITGTLLKSVLASFIMGIFLFNFKMNIILAIIISTGIYFTILIYLKAFSEDEINIIKSIVSFRK